MKPFRPIEELYVYLHTLVEGKLWLKVLIGLGLGIITGLILGPAAGLVDRGLAETLTGWFALPGYLFLRLVQMIMIPLIISSIIMGIAGGGNADQIRSMGPNVAIYFIATTAFAVLIGVLSATIIRPGLFIAEGAVIIPDIEPVDPGVVNGAISLPVVISELLPNNPLAAMVSGEMLSIVIFAVITGIALLGMNSKNTTPIMNLLSALQEVCMTITRWAMKLAPFAVFGLITQITARVGIEAIAGLGMYFVTVFTGLTFLILMYVLLLFVVTEVRPAYFFRSAKELMLLAFSVASSAAVMPMSMKTAEEKFGVNPSTARFIIPVGATINMNGTAAFQAIATIFLAQVYGLDLNLMSILLLVITTVAASIGTPSTPGAGVIILATVLSTVGIPIEGIALIIGVDNILGMARTTVNVTGDLTACIIFDRLQGRKDEVTEKELPILS